MLAISSTIHLANCVRQMPYGDSATYDVSPLNNTASPRLFWKGRDSPTPFSKGSENQLPYDPEACYMPARRPSLEDLKRVSRVKNHTFREGNQEYDPAHVSVPQRPLAADRSPNRESQMNLAKSQFVDEEYALQQPRPHSPSKEQPSPGKSSLSKASRYGKGFDPQSDIWSEYDSAGHRHNKSVTFDAAPPQVNEYEMRTPDPASLASESRETSYDSEEEEEVSFDHDTSMDRDDSFDASLEDIEKTPVVLPDEWRFMSPGDNNEEGDSYAETMDDSVIDDRPVSREGQSTSQHSRVESLDSNGDRRPLPPLPSVSRMSGSRPTSSSKTSVFELGSGSQRGLPAPLAPAFKKSDLKGDMSLEDRLALMMLQDKEKSDKKDETEDAPAEDDNEEHEAPQADEASKPLDKDDVFSPPRISRDSILRDIRKNDSYDDDDIFGDDSQIASSPNPYDHYDPDVPIPSLEMDEDDDDSSSVIIKEEAHDDELYAIPDYYQNASDNSLSSRDQRAKYDEDSNYSLRSAAEAAEVADAKGSGQTTPVAEDKQLPAAPVQDEPQQEPEAKEEKHLDMASIRESLGRPVTPEIKEEPISEPSTPESVIRHPIEDDEEEEEEQYEDEPEAESSSDESVPEPIATIRAPGAGLKTRPSLTPADMEAMAATRRQISGQHAPPVPPMPLLDKQISNDSQKSGRDVPKLDVAPQLPLPGTTGQRHPSLMQLDMPFTIQEESLGSGLTKEFDRVIESQKVAFDLALSNLYSYPHPASRMDRSPAPSPSPGLSTQHIPTTQANLYSPKQRGYLMRQNTKVVIASNRNEEEAARPAEPTSEDPRGTRSAGSSPRKASQQTWTTVPWNGSTRRPSVKMAGTIPKKKPLPGSVPPLPGQASNVQEAPATIDENEALGHDVYEDGEERGRLFVKVVGIKYIDLPLPRGTLHFPRHTYYYSLT